MTNAEYWLQAGTGAKWRTARKEHICSNRDRCKIAEGARYFDTGETSDWPHTVKICEKHANQIVK